MSWSELIYMGREYERLNSQKESLEKENKELKKAIKWLAQSSLVKSVNILFW
jgi:cell division septum initiation protein DivIVA